MENTVKSYDLFKDPKIKEAIANLDVGSSVYFCEGDVGFEIKKPYETYSLDASFRQEDLSIYTMEEFNAGEVTDLPEYAMIYASPRRTSVFNPGNNFDLHDLEAKGFKLVPVVETEHGHVSLRLGNTKSVGNHWDESIAYFLLPPGSEVGEITQETVQALEDWMNNNCVELHLIDQHGRPVCSTSTQPRIFEANLLEELADQIEWADSGPDFSVFTQEVQIVSKDEFEEKFGVMQMVRTKSPKGPGF